MPLKRIIRNTEQIEKENTNMTLQQNIRAVLDTNFTETRDDIKDTAEKALLELADNKLSEVWVVSRMIPGAYSVELRFCTNEAAAKNFCAKYQGAEYNKYPLVESFTTEDEN